MPHWMIAIYSPNSPIAVTVLRLKRGEAERLAKFIKTRKPYLTVEVIAHD